MMNNSKAASREGVGLKCKEKERKEPVENVGNCFGIIKHRYNKEDKTTRNLFLHATKLIQHHDIVLNIPS